MHVLSHKNILRSQDLGSGLSVLGQMGMSHVLHPSVSLLHTERVQGCAGVCRLEMKPNLQTSILGKNTVGLWLSSWFCFTSARCWYFSVAASPRPAERHRLREHRQISLKKPCLGITNLHAKYEWKFMVFWILGGGWEMPSLPVLPEPQLGMLEGRATTLLPLPDLGYVCVSFQHPLGL